MQSSRMKSSTKTMIILSAIIILQVAVFVPTVTAQANSTHIIDIDDQVGDGYERKISANQSAEYHWTLYNDGTTNFTYNVSFEIKVKNDKWTAQLVPDQDVTLEVGDTETVTLIVFAPNIDEGSTDVTITFSILRNDHVIHREERITFTSLQPLEKDPLVMGWFENPLPSPLDNIWGIFLLTILVWLGISLLIVFIMDPFVKAFTRKTKTEVDDIILRIIRTPILVLVFFYGVVSSLRILENEVPEVVIEVLNSIYGVVAVLIIFYVAYKLFKDILVYYGELIADRTSSNIDNIVIPIVEKIGVVIIGLVALGYLLGYLNVDLTMFVAGGVVISMVIAFAAQETLSNFFSGIFILTDRPFKEEDTIILPDGEWYEVRDIGLRSTRLFRYKDASLISIPNNKLAGDMIVNFSNPQDKTRLRLTFGAAYGSDPDRVKDIILEVANKNPHVISDEDDKKPFVKFVEHGESSVNFLLQVIVDERSERWGVSDYLYTEVYKRFNEEGIDIPFPQRTVWMKKDEG